ncbi:MAG: hypothetical protein A2915_00995 [Candidatus Yanofskybacteria bacterium RIFCSPLOWO2_01_FULL_41_34]|nr:MAG: hypothetical protein A2915_00995 [Candidatus Yanofskybacteria bacterium RIFCSPLOWO2_01_FULL_41_34]
MSSTRKLKKYSSKKHPVLEFIFRKYYNPKRPQKTIPFYLSDISDGYRANRIPEPVSISNTILDLTRQDRGVDSRLPKSISRLGYDLRKKTGEDQGGHKYAGEFMLVGVGNSLKSWLAWPKNIEEIVIDSSLLPPLVAALIRSDEAGLFSVIDYTGVFSKILHGGKREIHRVQNPMKWQPNEIDGFYASQRGRDIDLYPVEAKALTTGDEINLDQLRGGFLTVIEQMKRIGLKADVQQVAIKMIENGINVAIFPINQIPRVPEKCYRVKFKPVIHNWQKKR